jgi:cation/acetate symporter
VLVLMACSFTYVTAQIFGTGIIASRFLGMPSKSRSIVGLAGILLCSMLGGMRAVTWTQVAQYIVLIVAYLTPIVILSTQEVRHSDSATDLRTGDRGHHGARSSRC